MVLEEIFHIDQMKFILGFLVGAIIGLERQLSEMRKEEEKSVEEGELRPGVRTFGLLSLFGTISTMIAIKYDMFSIMYFSLAITTALISIYAAIKYILKDYGITTPVALALSFLLGILVGIGELSIAITLSVLVTFILTSKDYVINFIKGLEFKEIRSALEIGLLFFLLLPIVPNTLDPFFHAVNLRTFYLFLLVVLILGFLAYIFVKKLSPVKGILTFSAIGAIFSSEAVTVNLLRFTRENEEKEVLSITKLGILTSNLVMIIRTLVLAIILLWHEWDILTSLFFYTMLSILLGLLVIFKRYSRESNMKFGAIEIGSPLSYTTAAKFVSIFALITFFVIFLQKIFLEPGAIIGSFLGGFVSNLAVLLSVSSLYLTGQINRSVAEISIILGTISAILNKVIYSWIEYPNRKLIKGILLDILLLVAPMLLTIYLCYFFELGGF